MCAGGKCFGFAAGSGGTGAWVVVGCAATVLDTVRGAPGGDVDVAVSVTTTTLSAARAHSAPAAASAAAMPPHSIDQQSKVEALRNTGCQT